ncbi:cyclodeaminase/cyclohydrolase family protein [Claveliimonas sp.]|uniref:cyclodeaminase/cyclohydrolase family protein n=1 Tax=Claveliimonas sp. TaxID=3076672 RepID=UPI00307C57E5
MMLEKKTTEFLEELSSAAPVPGGGGASAAVGAFAAALGLMVANLTIGKKKYKDVENQMEESKKSLEFLKEKLIRLTDQDAEAFVPLAEAYRLPKETEEEKKYKEQIMEEALYQAAIVPLQIMETIHLAMEELELLGKKGNLLAVSDAGTGALFAQAAMEGAAFTVFINTKLMKDKERAEDLNARANTLIAEGRSIKEDVCREVMKNIK